MAILLVAEVVVMARATDTDRPRIASLLIGTAIGATAVVTALWTALRTGARPTIWSRRSLPVHHRRHTTGSAAATPKALEHPRPRADVDESWFTGQLTDFPTHAVRPLLRHDTDLATAYLAWVFAAHGHDAAWLNRHFDLPPHLADLLATTAHRRTKTPTP